MGGLFHLLKPSRRAVLLSGGAMVLAPTVDAFRQPAPAGVVEEQEAWQRIYCVTDRRNVDGYVGFDHEDLELILGVGPVYAVEGVGVGDARALDAVEQVIDRCSLNHLNVTEPIASGLLIIAAPRDGRYSMESHRAFAMFVRTCAQSSPLRGGLYALGVYRDAALNDAFRVTLIFAAAGREI
jgi:hypothetical protein